MGTSDIAPPGVPDYVVPMSGHMLSVGGVLWTASYLLYARESLCTKSYGMPLWRSPSTSAGRSSTPSTLFYGGVRYGPREGKLYGGRVAGDTTEMGYWTAAFAQILLSTASLAQLLVREHSGGVNWSIWATRFAGSLTGLWAAYLWLWYHWPEGHPYVVSEISIFLMIVSIACDVAYAPVLWSVRRTEKILPDGSKVAANYVEPAKMSKAL
ncbi:hypothetical protein MAPG_01812 [Magnaporthiopsis poae ATCC 64411]|uniref:Integral membrane protein n=1 Tax=Magnaporthiopsis poae (strain ATCC 64411 / 73-15) TaxID=644358 RepID=A0A0C4DPP1_MAGP6|nr:hypothetical protein MAPG_01812 [Magnaporthiopsis poae ATCC 64411]